MEGLEGGVHTFLKDVSSKGKVKMRLEFELKTKRWKRSNRQLQNKMFQVIKTGKKKKSTVNYPTLYDDQKYGRKSFGKRYRTILLLSRSWH